MGENAINFITKDPFESATYQGGRGREQLGMSCLNTLVTFAKNESYLNYNRA